MEVITHERNEELRAKLTLLEGDRKAYIECAIHALSENKKRVSELRAENNKLRSLLREGLSSDDHIINHVFHNRQVDRACLANKSGAEAITVMDYRTCDAMKKYNSIQHMTEQKEKRIESLKKQYQTLSKEVNDSKATAAGTNKDGKRLRELENRLEKAQLKHQEAEHIRRTYEQIRDKYQEVKCFNKRLYDVLKEQRSYSTGLDSLEKQIKQARQELDELQAMHDDAILSRDAAQKELKFQEEVIIVDRRRRESELSSLKRVAEGKGEHGEKVLTARDSLGTESVGDDEARGSAGQSGVDRSQPFGAGGVSEDLQQKIANFEESFGKIKEATGVSNLNSIVKRFEDQGETLKHLMELKEKASAQCQQLREKRDQLQRELEDLKYTGETELTSSNQLLEKYQQEADAESIRREELTKSLAEASQLLVQCKAGVEHISDKLTFVSATSENLPPPSNHNKTDEILPELLNQCNERLGDLMTSLEDVDIPEQLKMMEDEEFFGKLDGKMPDNNTRIKFPLSQKEGTHEEEEGPGEENDILTRALLKKQAQQLVEARNKKRQPRKKKRRK